MPEHEPLKGLSGWLILIGIGLIVAPILYAIGSWSIYNQIFAQDIWPQLTDPTFTSYHPLWRSLIIGKLVVNISLMVAFTYLLYLFFSKHYLFPKVYIAVTIVTLIIIPVDAWLVTLIIPEEPIFNQQDTSSFIRGIIHTMIWLPYMLISKRVKLTFVEHKPVKDLENESAVERF